MYNKLLVAAGNGIENECLKDSQSDWDPAVIIGIGGTGVKALETLKKKLQRNVKMDNNCSRQPCFSRIRFLAIDSDDFDMRKTNLDMKSEYISIQKNDYGRIFENKDTKNAILNKPQFQWMSEDLPILENIYGASAIRQIGRYLLIDKAQEIYDAIKLAIDNVAQDADVNRLTIHVIAGISGGTGSGCFLDTCYVIRKILEDKILEDNGYGNAGICGYFFLPDVITSIPELSNDTRKRAQNYANGYAALRELDYHMDLTNAKDWFEQDYGNFKYKTQVPPVDMCHLLSSYNSQGNIVENAFSYSMNVIAEYIMAYLSEAEIPKQMADFEGLTMKGHMRNISCGMMCLPIKARAWYHAIGAASAEMPMIQAATYLAAGLFERMKEGLRREPTDPELEMFVQSNQMTVNDYFRKLLDNTSSITVPIPDMKAVKGIQGEGVHSNLLIMQPKKDLETMKGVITANAQGLVKALSSYDSTVSGSSFIADIFQQLVLVCKNKKKGPRYAAALINKNGKGLRSVLSGLQQQAQNMWKDARVQVQFHNDKMEQTKNEFNAAGPLKSKKKYEAYRNEISQYYNWQATEHVYKQMQEMLNQFDEHLRSLYEGYFKPLVDLLNNLEGTFEANAQYFADGHGDDAKDDGFTQYIIKFSEMRPQLDKVWNSFDEEAEQQELSTYLVENYEQWIQGKEEPICKLVTDYVIEKYTEILNQSMQQVLLSVNVGMNGAKLQKMLEDTLFVELDRKALPLFWNDNAIYKIEDDTYKKDMLSVPVMDPAISGAAQAFQNHNGGYTVRQSNIGDRIFVLRCKSGIPLYAYQALGEMKKEYRDSSDKGIHLHSRDINWREYLPWPEPYSLKINQEEKTLHDAEIYEEAISQKIIQSTKNTESGETSFVIKTREIPENIENLLKDLGAFEEKDKKSEKEVMDVYFSEHETWMPSLIKETEEKLTQYETESLEKAEKVDLLDNGMEKVKDAVRKDNFLRYPVLCKIAEAELEKRKAFEKAKEELPKLAKMVAEKGKMNQNFFNALFTGFLEQKIGKIIFMKETVFGAEEVALANQTMKYKDFMLYQAFLSYKELEEADRIAIDDCANAKLLNLEEGDEKIACKLVMQYQPAMMANIKNRAASTEAYKDILAFYEEFMKSLWNYLNQFQIYTINQIKLD